MLQASRIDVVEAPRAHHGEGPVWDATADRLLWVDLTAGEIHALRPETGELRTHAAGREVGVAVPRRAGGLALAVREGFATLDDDGRERVLAAPLADAPQLRMNDGACDPEGRFWAGSMAYDARPGAGCLYRLDPSGALTTVLESDTISNGLAWDPEARWLYYIDSATAGVDRFAYDRATGEITGRRRVIDVPAALGEPDGMTVDADGCLWVAIWDGGEVRRHHPDGRLLEVLELPVRRPTSCAFGGPDLDLLFVTTSRFGLDAEALGEQPLAGALFVADVGTRGLPTAAFGG
jgi:sugar lactone lactonase YvrE